MAKKVQELKADTVLKNYWNNKEQFADLFNAVLFQGETVIKAEGPYQNTKEIFHIRSTLGITGVREPGAYPLCDAYEDYGV